MDEPSPTALAEFVPALLANVWETRPANVDVLRNFMDAALLAGADRVFEECWQHYEQLPDSAFTSGVLTNVDPALFVPAYRWKPTRETAAERVPPYDRGEIERFIEAAGRNEKHVALAMAGEWDAAYRAADGVLLALEDVGAVQALLGDPDEALACIARNVPEPRRVGPISALAVELARRGDAGRARELARHVKGDWMPICIAFGWLGRQPWGGYPLVDW